MLASDCRLFKTVKMAGDYWGVFIMNPTNPEDRYLVTSTFDKEKDADQFMSEFNRIAYDWKNDL